MHLKNQHTYKISPSRGGAAIHPAFNSHIFVILTATNDPELAEGWKDPEHDRITTPHQGVSRKHPSITHRHPDAP
jgi:hypothetical protein